MTNRMPEEFIRAAKRMGEGRWVIRTCSMCEYPLGYVFKDGEVAFDSGCDCVDRKHIETSSWVNVAATYNVQSDEVRKLFDEFWGFNVPENEFVHDTCNTCSSPLHNTAQDLVCTHCGGKCLRVSDLDYVEVTCIVLPTGQALYHESSLSGEYSKKVISKWITENQAYDGTCCTVGAIKIRMLRKDYQKISAVHGTNQFEFPKE